MCNASRMGASGLLRFFRKQALIRQTGTPLPLARVRTFSVDPSEHGAAELDDLPGERVVFYVEIDGTIVSPADDEFAELEAQTGEWSEVVKVYGDDDDEDAI